MRRGPDRGIALDSAYAVAHSMVEWWPMSARSSTLEGRERVNTLRSFVFCTGQYDSGDWDSAPSLPANLIDSVARYTSIAIAPSGVSVPLSSDALLEYPLVYLTGHQPVRFSEAERRNVRRVVERGGMPFVDDHTTTSQRCFHARFWRRSGALCRRSRICPTITRFIAFFPSPTVRRRRATS